jgi:hypothetical protein
VKTTRVDSVVLTLPMLIDGATPMLGGRAGASIDMLLVRVETDAGITAGARRFDCAFAENPLGGAIHPKLLERLCASG